MKSERILISSSENNEVDTIPVYLYNNNFGGLHQNIINSSRGKAGNETFSKSRDAYYCCYANVDFAKLSTFQPDKF